MDALAQRIGATALRGIRPAWTRAASAWPGCSLRRRVAFGKRHRSRLSQLDDAQSVARVGAAGVVSRTPAAAVGG
jgi:hypothetical protein